MKEALVRDHNAKRYWWQFSDSKKQSKWLAVRFVVAGLVNSLVGLGLFGIPLLFGFTYPQALAVSLAGAVTFNFFTYGKAFRSSWKLSQLARFVPFFGLLYVVNLSLLGALIGVGLRPFWAQLLLVGPIGLFSFYALRKFVFNESRRGWGLSGRGD